MKKILPIMLGALIFTNVSFATPTIYEKPDVKIIVEGVELKLESEVPVIVNSRTLVPLRKLLVGLGVPDNTKNIKWIGETREVEVNYNGVKIELAIDSSKGYINGKEYILDCAPIIHKDRTYLPARFVGEALNYTVSWDKYTPAVLVTSNENMNKTSKILDNMNFVMDNVKSYEVSVKKTSEMESIYDDVVEKSYYTSKTYEKADLENEIIYTEVSYKDNIEENVNCSYNTSKANYANYRYIDASGNWVENDWDIYSYVVSSNQVTPFDNKEKLGLIKVDSSLYGSLVCEEKSNVYVISAVSNHLDILKSLNGEGLFNESLQGNVDKLDFYFEIDKTTYFPKTLKVSIEKEQRYESEKIDYLVEFLEYNEEIDLDVPDVI